MNRVTIVFIFIISFSVRLSSQAIDNMSKSVVFLESIRNDTSHYGTGFFIASDINLYLVTAEHVTKQLSRDFKITFLIENNKPFTCKIIDFISSNNNWSWVYHPDSDIALLKLNPDIRIQKLLFGHFEPHTNISNSNSSPSRDVVITIIGFPLHLGIQEYFSPITRETKPASGLMYLKRGDKNKMSLFYISQDPSIGGFSGAPVYDTGLPRVSPSKTEYYKTKPIIVGMVHGTLSDETGGKFGAIIPGFKILEIIALYENRNNK